MSDDDDFDKFFEQQEDTQVTPPEVQDELLHRIVDTDPEFKNSQFWFRFQLMEREIIGLRDSFEIIYKLLKMHWDKPAEISAEHLSIIFQIVIDIVEGEPPDQDEITITT